MAGKRIQSEGNASRFPLSVPALSLDSCYGGLEPVPFALYSQGVYAASRVHSCRAAESGWRECEDEDVRHSSGDSRLSDRPKGIESFSPNLGK